MGSWGTDPWDNDTAADWFSTVIDPLIPQIGKALLSKEPEEVIAAAWLLSHVGRNFIYNLDFLDEHINLAIEKLQSIDQEWIDSWRDPEEIKDNIKNLITTLKSNT